RVGQQVDDVGVAGLDGGVAVHPYRARTGPGADGGQPHAPASRSTRSRPSASYTGSSLNRNASRSAVASMRTRAQDGTANRSPVATSYRRSSTVTVPEPKKTCHT